MPGKNNFLRNIALIFMALGGCGAFGWYIFTGTPRYSLSQLKDAIQQSDRTSVQEYVDSEGIASQIVETAIETVGQQINSTPQDIFGRLGTSLGLGILGTIQPMLEQQIQGYIEATLSNPSDIPAENLKLVAIKHTGEGRAIATFDISQIPNSHKLEKQSISVLLEQQENRQWKIIGLSEETLAMFAKLASQQN